MDVLLLFLTGAALAVSAFHLVCGRSDREPEFGLKTLQRHGYLRAFAIYCCAGPVLVVRDFDMRGRGGGPVPIRYTAIATLLATTWSLALGVLAIGAVRFALG